MVPTLKFHIKGQRLEVEPIGETLVENSVNFLKASVTLDNLKDNKEWLGLTLIKVGFYHNGKNYPVEVKLSSLGDKSEEFFIPWEAIKTPGFVVSVVGTKYQKDNITLDVLRKITTNTIPVQLKQSGSLGGIVSSNFGSETDFVLALQILEEKVGKAEDTVKKLEEEFEALENLVKGSEKINVGVNLLQNSQLIHHYSNLPDTLPRTEVEGFDEKEKYYFYRYTYDHAARPKPTNSILISLYNQIPLSDITVPLKIAEGSDTNKDVYTLSFWARAKTEGEAVFTAWIKDKNISQDTLKGINGTLSHGDRIKLTPEWTRYHMTIKLERNYDSETGALFFCPGDIWQTVKEGEVRDLNYYIDLCNWKIEKGDKPTNWSSSLEKYEKQATEIRTSLLQTKEAIIAEVDGKLGDLEGNVTEVTNKLTVDINGIDMKCTESINGLNKSFADFKVTADKIASIVSDGEYGVNLLVNSGLKSEEDYNSEHWIAGMDAFTLPKDENGENINWSHATLKNSFSGKVYQKIPEKAITPDEYYVLSLNVKVEKAGAENDRISLFEAGKKNINSSTSYEKIGSTTDRVIYLNEERDWTRYTLLLQYPKDKLELYQSKDNYELIVGLDFIHIGDATVCVKEMKLERGVVPTDWAPGDEKKYTSLIEQKANEISFTVTEQIDGVTKNVTEISQRADEIVQSVANLEEGVNSKIEQTAGKIRAEISDLSADVASSISQTAEEIRAEITNLSSDVASNISQTAEDIRTEVFNFGTNVASKIEQTADSIKSIISSTQNLLENSSFSYKSVQQEGTDKLLDRPEKWWSNYPVPYEDKNENFRDLARISTPTGYNQMVGQSVKEDLKRRKKYTASVKFTSGDNYLNLNLVDKGYAYIMVEFKDENGDILQYMSKLEDYSINTGWKTVKVTFEVPEKEYTQEQVIIGGHSLPANSLVYFKEAKLELGEEATEWEESQSFSMEQSLNGLDVRIQGLDGKASEFEVRLNGFGQILDGIEEGQTDYIKFDSEGGLVVGNWVQGENALGGNVRLITKDNIPRIELRNNTEAYAIFAQDEIHLAPTQKTRDEGGNPVGQIGKISLGAGWGSIYGEYAKGMQLGGERLCLEANDFVYLTGQCGILQEALFEKNNKAYYTFQRNAVATNVRDAAGLGYERTPFLVNEISAQILKPSIANPTEKGRSTILFSERQYNSQNTIVDLLLSSTLTKENKDIRSEAQVSPEFVKMVSGVQMDGSDPVEKSGIYITPDYAGVSIGTRQDGKVITTPLHYRENDSITLSWQGGGFITNSGFDVRFSIPLAKIIPKELEPVLSLVLTNGTSLAKNTNIYIRQEGYIFSGKDYVEQETFTWVDQDNIEKITVSANGSDGNFLIVSISMYFTDNLIKNNRPCGVDIKKIKLTFKKKKEYGGT
jgi:hypothetical protein